MMTNVEYALATSLLLMVVVNLVLLGTIHHLKQENATLLRRLGIVCQLCKDTCLWSTSHSSVSLARTSTPHAMASTPASSSPTAPPSPGIPPAPSSPSPSPAPGLD